MRIPRYLCAALAVAALLVLFAPAVGAAENGTAPTAPTGDQQIGYIQINTTPDGATVFVNRTKMSGLTPFTIKVPAMTPQEIVINKYGYATEKMVIIAPPNGTIPYTVTLRTLPGVDRPETDQPGAGRSPTAPAGEAAANAPTGAATAEGAEAPESPLSPFVALAALAGAGLLIAGRR